VDPGPAAPRTLVSRLMDCDLRLAEADSPRKRVEALADLADALHSETRAVTSVAGADDLGALATMYEQVIRDGVVPRARALPAGQRKGVLDPIVSRLSQAERDVRQLAGKADAAAARPLLAMAAAAGAGDRQLRALMGEDTPGSRSACCCVFSCTWRAWSLRTTLPMRRIPRSGSDGCAATAS